MKLKVCGMKYQDNIQQVAKLQPDYLGFIFYEKSSRFFDEVIQIPAFAGMTKGIKKVGVFVDESLDEVLFKIKKYDLDAVQLHSNESPEYCKKLKALCHSVSKTFGIDGKSHRQTIEIIKVFSIGNDFNFKTLKSYEDIVDYYLFDTKGKLPGGNGYTFNWEVLKDYLSTKPYFLSGGIGLPEIESLQSFLGKDESKYCYAIDVNSKFEIKPGLKHIELLKNFKNRFLRSQE